MRSLVISWCLLIAPGIAAADDTKKPAPKNSKTPAVPVAPKSGVKTPGVQIPFANLKAEAEIPVETPGLAMMSGSILVPNRSKDVILKIDARSNKPGDPIGDVKQPCSGMVNAFGSLWVPSCASGSVVRIDAKIFAPPPRGPARGMATEAPKEPAKEPAKEAGKEAPKPEPAKPEPPKTEPPKPPVVLSFGVADMANGIAATADSVWLFTDAKSTLSRIDPATNTVVDTLRIPANCSAMSFGEMSLWVACPSEVRILRVNPLTNLVDKRIEVSAGARSIAFGAGSVWVLCEKEGKIERIDPKTNKVIKTIETNVPNAAGEIAFGEGFLWVTQNGFPLTRIDVTSEKEKIVQQFWGEGGGRIVAAPGAIWLSNTQKGSLWRIDPKRVYATLAE